MFSSKYSDEDEEDDLFSAASKSSQHLANLFNTPMQSAEEETLPSLKYVAPKKSNLTKTSDKEITSTNSLGPQTSTNTVVFAKRVTAYKYSPVNSKYELQGALGLAIVEITQNLLKIILYKDKQNIICSNSFIKERKITVQQLYSYFKDDENQNWSVLFENTIDLDDFLMKLKQSDLEIIKHDSNTENLKGNIKRDENVLEQHTDVNSTKHVQGYINKNSMNENIDKKISETNIEKPVEIKDTKAKILSLMEKMGQSKLLPEISTGIQNNKTTDSSESSDNEIQHKIKQINSTSNMKPLAKPRKLENRLKSVVNSNFAPIPQYAFVNGQLIPVQNSSTNICLKQNSNIDLPGISSTSLNTNLDLYLCENRVHNSETRMNISKLEQKLEKLLDKVDTNKETKLNEEIFDYFRQKDLKQEREIDSLKSKLRIYEEKFVANDLKEPNLDIVNAYESKIQDLEAKLQNIEQKSNANNLDEPNLDIVEEYESKIRVLEAKLQDLNKLTEYENVIENLKSKLHDFEDCYNAEKLQNSGRDFDLLKQKLNVQQQVISENESKICDLQTKLAEYYKENNERVLELENEILELKSRNKGLEEKLKFYESTNDVISDKFKATEMKLQISERDLNLKIKSIMNGVFGILTEKFVENKMFDRSEILMECKQAIKEVTLGFLRNENEKSHEENNENSSVVKGAEEILENVLEKPEPLPPDFDV